MTFTNEERNVMMTKASKRVAKDFTIEKQQEEFSNFYLSSS